MKNNSILILSIVKVFFFDVQLQNITIMFKLQLSILHLYRYIWEDSLEEGMPTQFNILLWRITMDRGVWHPTVHQITKSKT